MGDSQNWRTEVDAVDYFGHQKKQLQVADRRPVIRRASDLVGPGLSANAVRLTNFNDRLATYNGFFSADEGAIDAPTSDQAYVGTVTSDAELGGVQMFTGLETSSTYHRTFRRNPSDANTLYWGAWKLVVA